MSMVEAAESVKLAENLPSIPSTSSIEQKITKDSFNHKNPFNLDLTTLSEYQKIKHNAEESERRRDYQIIRRTMETKALKSSEEVERLKQEIRDEKFQMPKFFKVFEPYENVEAESSTEIRPSGCKYVSMTNKPKNQEIMQLHYKHKEDKLRERLRGKAEKIKHLVEETEKLEEEERENFGFDLADKSFPPSECDSRNQHVEMKELPAYEKFDYPVNESELYSFKQQMNQTPLEVIKREKLFLTPTSQNGANEHPVKIDIPWGQKIKNRVVLRNFHDRICDEPRGEANCHRSRDAGKTTYLTREDWLKAMSNDPEILKEPPKCRIVSTLKVEQDPNDDKLFIFDNPEMRKKSVTIVSPIRQHIQQIDEKLRNRYSQTNAKKSKSHMSVMNKNQNAKRSQRMKFMGIPQTAQEQTKVFHADLKAIVAKVSQTSILSQKLHTADESKQQYKYLNVRFLPEDVKLIPEIPECDYKRQHKRERLKTDKFVPFSKAQPHGNNTKTRIDKSLPSIQDELNATRAKLEREHGNPFLSDIYLDTTTPDTQSTKEIVENSSALKKAYNEVIANKLQNYKTPLKDSVDAASTEKNDEKGNLDGEMHSTVESSSSLSSVGTYFTNDSGSFVIELGNKIPKSQIILKEKFQNRSLLTTQEQPPYDLEPYFIPNISHFNIVKELCKPKDKFHTYRTRSCANIRERIKIESPDYEDEFLETVKLKSAPQFTTDIDKYYQSELYHERSRTKFRFKPITEMNKLRESLRKKMDTQWIKERMVLDQVDTLKQELMMERIKSQADEYNSFLNDYKKNGFVETIKKMQELKNLYQETDRLRKVLDEFMVQMEPLKMTIFLLGNEFVRLTVLQKFQFLVKPTEWRIEHDYIHRASMGELENNRNCINNRETAKSWNRNNVTVYTIKNFIENVHIKEEREKISVFENGEELLKAFQELRAKSYRSLLQFHLVAHASTDTEKEFITLEDKNKSLINHWNRMATILTDKRIFIEARAKTVEQTALKLIDKPMEESVSNEKLHNLRGLCNAVFQKIVLKKGDPLVAKYYSSTEKISEVEKKIFGILGQLDRIPREIIKKIEDEVRNERNKKLLQAERAQKIELGVHNRIKQLRRCLAKPPKKEKHEGKLPMSVLPKKPSKIKIKKSLLTPMEEEYIRAFTELGADGNIRFDDNAKMMISRIQNESTPFYLEHFLDTLGFKIPKETEAEAERILLDEAKNFKYKDVLPNVRRKVQHCWRSKMKWLSRKIFEKLHISMNYERKFR